MENKLLKTIESSISAFYCPNETLPRLTAFPATDFVNPGLGQISRLYSFYVPLHSQRNLFSLQKKVESTSAELLEGFGSVDVSEKDSDIELNEKESIDKDKHSDEIESQMKADPIEYNEKKQKRLGFAIQETFLHPKLIKTDTLFF
jgi:hypothetical protein